MRYIGSGVSDDTKVERDLVFLMILNSRRCPCHQVVPSVGDANVATDTHDEGDVL